MTNEDARDLMAFEQANPRDVRLVDDGGGLAFAFCGVIPERRFLLPALYPVLQALGARRRPPAP